MSSGHVPHRSLPRPTASAWVGGAPASDTGQPSPASQQLGWAPGTRGPGSGEAGRPLRGVQPPPRGLVPLAKFAVPPLLRLGFPPLPRPRPRPLPGALLGASARRRTAASAHPGLAPFGLSLFLKSRKSIFPKWAGARLDSRGGSGGGGGGASALMPPPPPSPAPPRPGIDPASCVHRISPNGFADDSTSFSLKADPRSSPLLRLRLSRPRRPLRGAPAARGSQGPLARAPR